MNVRKIFTLVVTLMLCTSNSFALEDYIWSEHVNNTINSVYASSGIDASADINQVYFYNEETGLFLNVGDLWDTKVVAKPIGLPFKIVNQDNIYTQNGEEYPQATTYNIYTSEVQTTWGSYVSYYNDPTTPVWSLYADRKTSDGYARFQFVNANDANDNAAGKQYYYIKGFTSSEIKNISENRINLKTVYKDPFYISVGNDGTTEKLLDLTANEDKSGNKRAKWLLITLKDFKDRLDAQHIEAKYTDEAYATFFIKDQAIQRGKLDKTKSYWKGNIYETGDDKTYGDKNTNTNPLAKYGKYWHAYVSKKTGSVYQDVYVTKPGWYRITCQGFYHRDKNITAYFVARSTYVNGKFKHNNFSELNRIYDKFKTFKETDTDSEGDDLVINEGKALYEGKYPNSIMVQVDEDGFTEDGNRNRIRIEIKIEGSVSEMTEDDRVAFSNFQMAYSCKRAVVLDENAQSENSNEGSVREDPQPLILKRTFKVKKYNTFCLPVNLTKHQLKSAFGDGVKLATLSGVMPNKNGKVIHFDYVDINGKEDYEIVLKKNQFYLIYPIFAGDKEIRDGQQQRYYIIDNVILDEKVNTANSFHGSSFSTEENNNFDTSEEAFIRFYGTYINLNDDVSIAEEKYKALKNPNIIPDDKVVWGPSYILNDEDDDKYGFWRFYHPHKLKGFRCWIHQEGVEAGKALGKLYFSFGGENVVSSIEDLKETPVKVTNKSNKIYNIAGQEVKSNFKGIIIQNGKKYYNK